MLYSTTPYPGHYGGPVKGSMYGAPMGKAYGGWEEFERPPMRGQSKGGMEHSDYRSDFHKGGGKPFGGKACGKFPCPGGGKGFGGFSDNGGRKGCGDKSMNFGSSFAPDDRAKEDLYPQAAEKLDRMRSSLPEDARKAYEALQQALQRQVSSGGARPSFERDFREALSVVFNDAWKWHAEPIRTNIWRVQVDNGPPIVCSVRLEVLSDDGYLLHEVKSKAKIVKQTYNDDFWKGALSADGGGLSHEKLRGFQEECQRRCEASSESRQGGGGGQGFDRGSGGNRWVEKGSICEYCKRKKEEDQLDGMHVCKVFATFKCSDCNFSWNSHQGRLQPDGTVMGQKCMRCKSDGEAKDWRPDLERNREPSGFIGRPMGGGSMHKSELCCACSKYGNCMGIFYDPFVLTVALSMVSDHQVCWYSYDDVPGLLIADLGDNYEAQVCLQPHVYVEKPGRTDDSGGPRRGQGGGKGGPGRYADVPEDDGDGESLLRRGNRDPLGDGGESSDEEPRGAQAVATGVKNPSIMEQFLQVQAGSQGPTHTAQATCPGPGASGHRPPRGGGRVAPSFAAAQSSGGGDVLASAHMSIGPTPNMDLGVHARRKPPQGGDAGAGPPMEQRQRPYSEPPAEAPPAPQVKKTNKITANEQALGTPALDSLPPIRRGGYLRVVDQYMKGRGMVCDRTMLGEEMLVSHEGNYEVTMSAIKALLKQS